MTTRLALLLALLIPASAWAVKPLDIAVYAASEFDGATTHTVLQDCGNRCYETNLMVRPFADNPSIFPVMTLTTWGVNHMAHKLRANHRNLATAIQVIVIGAHVFAGNHNLAAAAQ